MTPTQNQIELAAAAIANARGGRRGIPEITNILEMLPDNLVVEVMQDAEAALKAAFSSPHVCPECGAEPLRLHKPGCLRSVLGDAAETIAAVADRINDACNGEGEIAGSATVDPLMRVHGELLAALDGMGREAVKAGA